MTDSNSQTEILKPPATSIGALGWIKANLFNGWFNSLLTLATLFLLWIAVPPFVRWAFLDSYWISGGTACREGGGACWSVVLNNLRFIIFGFYPYDQQWRPLVAIILLLCLVIFSQSPRNWKKSLVYYWGIGIVLMGILLGGWRPFILFLLLQLCAFLFFLALLKRLFKENGKLLGIVGCSIQIYVIVWALINRRKYRLTKAIIGFFSFTIMSFLPFLLPFESFLTPVESSKWGGLPLTLILSVFSLTLAYPLGVILALGRQTRLPVIRWMSVIYIEMIRGVPLISLLFMGSIIFPLFLPEGVTINNILRALVAMILFTAAYIAEVVRGGLQGMSKGQYEAADSLGLNYVLTMRLVILPQALKIVIPPTVSILISAFKDTSLVVIISLYDLLKSSQTVLSNPEWMGFSREIYLFVAILYFLGCFSMSNFSRKLERELDTGY